jgi:glycosyltransferase involved in cell wall biosynthesis
MGLMPLVSVVIPCLNRVQFLIPTLESVLNQDYPRMECIVVDGGSTDGTLDILQSYGKRIQWVSESDHGPPDAINKGWRMCGGDILAWLNADDLWAPGAVSVAVSYLQQNLHADVVYGDCGIIDHQGKQISIAHVREWDLEYAVEYCDHVIYQAASFMRRSILERVGWLWPKLCHDHELWLRISLAGGAIERIPDLLGYARHHVENLGYQADLVIPLKVEITKRFFDSAILPMKMRRLRFRALSNTYLRGIDYIFLSQICWPSALLKSMGLMLQAFQADRTNLVSIGRSLIRLADKALASILRDCLPGSIYDSLRNRKRDIFARI